MWCKTLDFTCIHLLSLFSKNQVPPAKKLDHRSSSDELSDSAALQTKEEGACKLARKAAMFVLN